MTTPAEKLKAGIDTLTWRIAALAERLPNEQSRNGGAPRDTVRQINEYVRAKRALQAELDALSVGGTGVSVDSVKEPIEVYDHTKSEDVAERQSWWKHG